ncbi:Ferrous iron transport protein B [Citrobacter freundii]|uniref:Fe(2+) transporter FeoB n=1 Tax=Citrobacter freundii TaxID=546 RepID=A0A7G2IWE8_CITFR|nr:Ferrous iron transport protein B [Citrobacter freundii]
MKKLTIGLIGNPNSGKTTLFNQLTGARQRVGNWAGVTVERKEGHFATTDHQVTLVDLPGTYSLTTISSQTSLDEQIACHYILSGDADLLINVVDASNLERNLYLTLQLLELGIPCIVALNMLDIAEKQQIRIDIDALSARLGCPVVPLVSTRARGIEALKLAIDRYKEKTTLSSWSIMPSRCCRKRTPSPTRWLKICRSNSAAGLACRCWKAISTAAPMRVMPRKISMHLSHA